MARHGAALKLRRMQPAWYHFVLVGVGSMLLTFAVVGLLLPPRYIVQREVEVMAPPALVFEQLSDTTQHPAFLPWTEADPTIRYTQGERTRGVGASYEWEGTNTPRMHYEVTAEEPGSAIGFEMVTNGPGDLGGVWNIRQFGKVTKVTWSLHGDVGWNIPARFAQLGADGALGPILSSGLGRLKARCEQAARAPSP